MLNYCANGPSGYNLTNSLRFRSSANATLTRTPASASNRTTWTTSFWFKRGALSSSVPFELFVAFNDTSNHNRFFFDNSTNILTFQNVVAGTASANLITTQVFRDPSAWYHIVVVWDTTQATASNRVKIYINGSQITSFSTATYPPQNQNSWINGVYGHTFGSIGSFNWNYDGYLAEWNFIDGQALTPSSFGSTNSTTGVWQPAKYTGTYGTNGFYLPFNKNSLGFSSYYGNFNGSNQSLSVANNTALNPETNDYCVEAFMYSTSLNVTALFDFGGNSGSIQLYFESGRATFRSNGSDIIDVPFNAPNQWVHIAVTRSGSSVRLFVNGIQQGSTVSNSDNLTSTQVKYIGRLNGGYYFNGRISNFRFVKGSAVYTSNFTVPTSALTAITNTQLLTLQNSTIIDNSTNAFSITNNNSVTTTSAIVGDVALITSDQSGNNNNWNPNNINYSTVGTTYDSMTDVPTLTSATVANYAVINPIGSASADTYSQANLKWTKVVNTTNTIAIGSIAISSGKWYWEGTVASSGGSNLTIGIGNIDTFYTSLDSNLGMSGSTTSYAYNGGTGPYKQNNNTQTSYGATFTTNDVIGVAFNADAGTLTFYKNNVSQGTAYTGITGTYYPACGGRFTNDSWYINFGQRPFTYTPPSGYVALNTYNLPTPTILQGNKYMDATLYTGNGGTQVIVNQAQFKPDFVWYKQRNTTRDNGLEDSVRGTSKIIISNSTAAEVTASGITGFNSNGFSIGNNVIGNESGGTYVGWQWQAGQGSTSSNTNGSITSTVSVNTTAGFSVVTYTGNSVNGATVGHGLGVTPAMIIIKERSAVNDWLIWHQSNGTQIMFFTSAAKSTNAGAFNNTLPTSSVITLGTWDISNGSPNTYVAYCWAEIAGFSKFGSYTGNGSADGSFVYTGFRPKYVMIKRSDSPNNWVIEDATRSPFNVVDDYLAADSSAAESTTSQVNIDFLSNGFKLRSGFDIVNAGTYIYAAFAENPFKNALAR